VNRFKIILSIAGMINVMLGAALATQSLQPPIYTLAPTVAFLLVVAQAGTSYLMSQMPSWTESDRATRAIDRDPRG
jgi:hypothetical protein